MNHAETEGTWDAAIRKIVWGVPAALVAIGLLVLLFAWLQPSCPATVTKIRETFYTPSRRMVRGTTDSHYGEMLEVEYTDARGERQSAVVQYGSTNPNALPGVGDQVRISRGLSGMVAHPNRNLIGIGGSAAVIGGLFLALYLLTWLKTRGKKRRGA